jgi:hypothetical protein
MKGIYRDRWLVAATSFVDEDRSLRRSVEDIQHEKVLQPPMNKLNLLRSQVCEEF